MRIRIYLRRSKNDEGKQQFSVDVQRQGCRDFIEHRLEMPDAPVIEYLDDGKAGDDFHSRVGMREMLAAAECGDIIVCRDQSRLGRDAIEVTLAIRDLVRDRECQLFYYATGQEVHFANAIDQATTFIQGTGHQMELEAIRSRTREALRSRVREGRVAGGKCYGYNLVRKKDGAGRPYTIARINKRQAKVIKRMYALYLAGSGLKAIAKELNREGVSPPSAGRRGSGSWSPGGIRPMLQNPRYRGVYMHGRIKKVRRAGKMRWVRADPSEVITVEVPEWRIIDDDTWFAVQEQFRARTPVKKRETKKRVRRPMSKYPLAGIARCGECGGSIGASYAKRRGVRVRSYSCLKHHQRGKKGCAVTVHQPMDEVEEALLEHLEAEYLTEETIGTLQARIIERVKAQMPGPGVEIADLEEELKQVRREQKRIAKAVALSDDIPELLAELTQRRKRIRHLEGQLEAAKRDPAELAQLEDKAEAAARGMVADIRSALAQTEHRKAVFNAMFREGLRFIPHWVKTRWGRRHVWRIVGPVYLDPGPLRVVTRSGDSDLGSDPETSDIIGSLGGGPLGSATPTGFEPVSPA